MNHAERVKELVLTIFEDGFSIRHGPNSSDKDAAFAAIDAMQSALDDANAKLAARDAEVERLRKDAERYRFIRDASRSDCITQELVTYAMESLDEYVDAAMEDEVRLNAALSEEVKGGE